MVRIVPFIKHSVCGAAMNCLFEPVCKIECSNACVSGEGEGMLFLYHYCQLADHWRLFVGCSGVKAVKYYCFSHINVRGVQVCKNISIKYQSVCATTFVDRERDIYHCNIIAFFGTERGIAIGIKNPSTF